MSSYVAACVGRQLVRVVGEIKTRGAAIGQFFGCSRERPRQIWHKALQCLAPQAEALL